MNSRKFFVIAISILTVIFAANGAYCQDDSTREILKQGLLGAGTGAIAAGASGGKAGQGALIGAGTGVIGGALLDMLTTPSSSRQSATQQEYYAGGPANGYADDYYYEEPPQESSAQKVLKQGLLGAGTGAIASGASGGNAGTGALIGAGTGVIGGALLDAITQPSQPRRVYRRRAQPQQYQQQYQPQAQQNVQVQEEQVGAEGSKKKIVKHYDASGKLVSEEEIYY